MENTTQEVQTTPERIVTPELGECPTCVSGLDPSVGTALFQEALRDAL
jgi:hypothetical protein